MFNLIRIAAPILALALVAWFVWEVFIQGDGSATTEGLPVGASVVASSQSA